MKKNKTAEDECPRNRSQTAIDCESGRRGKASGDSGDRNGGEKVQSYKLQGANERAKGEEG